jgi:hypothetical protein
LNGQFPLGLDVVVVVLDSIFFAGFTTVVLLSTFFSAGFTTVVLFSVFFSAGGLTVVLFCSHAPKSAAQAKMEISFFIGLIGLPLLKSQQGDFPALRKTKCFCPKVFGDDHY